MTTKKNTDKLEDAASLAKFDDLSIKDLIASCPANPRDSSRLMFLNKEKESIQHLRFNDITSLIRKDDCLVLNKSKVRKAKIKGVKSTGG
ncbi:MAG: S-adenosylmethionine:tRNA ribosyltransferase-isomerase, partial [Elusimicrobiales bacterium]|nr:S-adenosylmethionine:tRNA ribosyltransferase-isomerase [Elusimicrobiales bacterium]